MNAVAARKPANLSLDRELLREARALGVNLSRAAEDGIRTAVARRRRERWLEDNRDALASSNDYVDEHGLPLEKFRPF